MKKILLSTGVLLALTASLASATGIDLNWNNCLFSAPTRVADMQFICANSDPANGVYDGNGFVFQLYGSVRTGVNIPGVIAWGAIVDLQVAGPTLDPWWQLGQGQCRDGSITFVFNGFANVTSCNKTLMVTSPAPLPVANWQSGFGGPNRARYSIGVARTTGTTVNGAVKYQLFIASIDTRFTVNDPGDPSPPDHLCPGCLDPGCLVLNDVEVDQPATPAFDGRNHFTSGEIAQWVTWQGGAIGLQGCPAATPTHKATWGAVKSLYR